MRTGAPSFATLKHTFPQICSLSLSKHTSIVEMKIVGVLLLALWAFARADDAEIKEEEDVMVLTTKNFETAINGNEFVLVEFCKYACQISRLSM